MACRMTNLRRNDARFERENLFVTNEAQINNGPDKTNLHRAYNGVSCHKNGSST